MRGTRTGQTTSEEEEQEGVKRRQRRTVDVLGNGVENDVGSLSDGVGEVRGEEGVVDEN